jgi:NitT/TauT family transport system ATP-binding protein
MKSELAIKVDHVTKTFAENGDTPLVALRDINLEIARGEFFVLVGPSGSGKSTLLRIMSGLEKKFDGSVTLGPGIAHEDMSFVFQHFALLPWMTVRENVELNLRAREPSESKRKKRVDEELDRFGLSRYADTRPRDLSGGQQQRVGLARAFVSRPKIIFMDEAFSELDSFTARELRQEFLKIWKDTRETVVMVTHLIEEAVQLSDRVAVMTPQPGRIELVVDNRLSRPRKERDAAFHRLSDRLYKSIKP